MKINEICSLSEGSIGLKASAWDLFDLVSGYVKDDRKTLNHLVWLKVVVIGVIKR